jgi:hypothetical protein
MSRFYVLLLILPSLLLSRENPFLSTKESDDIPISNNYIESPDDFEKIAFMLPDSARVLSAVEVVYQNIDGSISRKRIDIEKKFDWKKKLALSYDFKGAKKSYSTPVIKTTVTKTVKKRVSKIVNDKVVYDKETVETKPVEKKEERKAVKDEIAVTHYMSGENPEVAEKALGTLNSQNSTFNQDGSDKAKKKAVSQNSSSIYGQSSIWGNQAPTQQAVPEQKIEPVNSETTTSSTTKTESEHTTLSIGKPKFIDFDFDIQNSTIKITTNDKKSRHFMLIRPDRIVIDFHREVTFPNQTFNIDKGIFGEVKLAKRGTNIYRISIYIEKGYRYNLNRTESGYDIECYKK